MLANVSYVHINYNSCRVVRSENGDFNVLLTTCIFILVISVLNFTLHLVGCFLLICLYKDGRRTIQQLLLINLSCVQCLTTCSSLIFSIANMLDYIYSDIHYDHLSNFFQLVNTTGLSYLFYFSMAYVTVDRLINSLLNIRYRIYCDKGKIVTVLFVTWCINISIGVAVAGIYFSVGMDTLCRNGVDQIIMEYIPAIFDMMFLVLVIASYSIMFTKFVSSQRLVSQNDEQESLFTIFRNSKFYISILLISAFLLLTVIPGLIIAVLKLTKFSGSDSFYLYTTISFCLSTTVDAIIYTFMKDDVRTLLFQIIFG